MVMPLPCLLALLAVDLRSAGLGAEGTERACGVLCLLLPPWRPGSITDLRGGSQLA